MCIFIGEIIMIVARGVGILVGIVAILSWFMIMLLFRALLAWFVHMWGVLGVSLIIVGAVAGAIRLGNIPIKSIITMLVHSCS